MDKSKVTRFLWPMVYLSQFSMLVIYLPVLSSTMMSLLYVKYSKLQTRTKT